MGKLALGLVCATLLACVGDSVAPNDGGGQDVTTQPDSGGTDVSTTQDVVTTDTSSACGDIGMACCDGGACNGGATCTSGTCGCGGSKTACNNACVDTTNDGKNCGACGHDCVGGTCSAGVCQAFTIVTGQSLVTSVAMSSTQIFWTRTYNNNQHGGVYVANLDGTGVSALYDPGPSVACRGVIVDGTDTYFYCTGALYHCALPSCSNTPTSLLAVTSVTSTALDKTNSRLYFTVGTLYNQQTGGNVSSIPLSGGASSRLVSADQPNPNALWIDSGYVYWLDSGTYLSDSPQKNGGVRKALFGTNQTQLVVVADNSGTDYGGLTVNGSTVFYGAGNAHQIHSVATVGGSASTYVSAVSSGAYINGVVADATNVYWTESVSSGGVYRCAKSTCTTPKALASAQDSPSPITQDAVSIAWGNTGGGEIRRIAK